MFLQHFSVFSALLAFVGPRQSDRRPVQPGHRRRRAAGPQVNSLGQGRHQGDHHRGQLFGKNFRGRQRRSRQTDDGQRIQIFF